MGAGARPDFSSDAGQEWHQVFLPKGLPLDNIGFQFCTDNDSGARENAVRNGIGNAEFVAGDVAKSVRPLLERVPQPDVVFVDPPRSGLTPKAVRRVLELAPERLVYVSCNPTTFAPNARQLVDAGYSLEFVKPLDMFPHTPHIECVARLRRQPGDSPHTVGTVPDTAPSPAAS